MKEQLKVDPIKNGTVIDHITAGKALTVIDIIGVKNSNSEVMIGMYLNSHKMGKKDILKIEDRELSQDEVNKIALVSPTATTIIIKDYKVIKKIPVEITDSIEGIIICPNPKCVTTTEKIKTKFEVAQHQPLQVRCEYCEKKYSIDELKFSV